VRLMFDPGTLPYFKFFVPVFDAAAKSLDVEVVSLPVLSESEIEPLLTGFARQPNGGLLVLGGSFTRLHLKEIAALAGRYQLPSIASIGLAVAGGLIDYGPSFDLPRHYAQAATYVDRILRGTKPGELPVQPPTNYKFVLNLKTAKALGLTVPNGLVLAADQVIE